MVLNYLVLHIYFQVLQLIFLLVFEYEHQFMEDNYYKPIKAKVKDLIDLEMKNAKINVKASNYKTIIKYS
mgnify:CR=1 FL=1